MRTLICLARRAGVHRQDNINQTAQDIQVRRLLWHQICFLDRPSVYSYGLQPSIQDDCDFRLPLNANDLDIGRSTAHLQRQKSWTDTTMTVMQHECNMTYRLIFKHQGLPDDALRSQVDKHRKRIKSTYLDHLDPSDPIQICAKLVGRMLITGFDVLMIYKQLRYERDAAAQQDLHNR